MHKNVAGQKIELFAFDVTTGLPKTGDAANLTAYVSKDGGTTTALTDTSATEKDATNAKGWYIWDTTQAETNADHTLWSGKSSTANVVVVARAIPMRPANFTSLGITTGGSALIQGNFKKGAAIARFGFMITDASSHAPQPGLTGITAERSIDGGAFAGGTLGAVTEVSHGFYWCSVGTGDFNGDMIMLKFTKPGYDLTPLILYPIP